MFKYNNKKIVSLTLCMIFLSLISVPVLAADKVSSPVPASIITPQYTYINRASSTLSISSSGTATIKGYVQRTTLGNSIYIKSTLQRYSNGSWSDISSWSETTSSPSASISEKYTVTKGQHRVATYFSVSGSSGTESDTVYSTTVTY